jgi:hypothetical protein
MNANQLRRLERLERQAAALPRPAGAVPPHVRAWLVSLTDEQLAAVEEFCGLMMLGPDRIDLLPAERLSDQEAVEAWRRLITFR